MNRREILEEIRKRVGSENLFSGNLLKRGNCSADLSGIAENARVVIDMDKIFPHGQQGKNQCECVIFYLDTVENLVVVLIELKGGKNAEAAKAVQQLKGGAAFAATYIPQGSQTICFPILFHNSMNKFEVRRLKQSQSKVHLGGKSCQGTQT